MLETAPKPRTPTMTSVQSAVDPFIFKTESADTRPRREIDLEGSANNKENADQNRGPEYAKEVVKETAIERAERTAGEMCRVEGGAELSNVRRLLKLSGDFAQVFFSKASKVLDLGKPAIVLLQRDDT